MAQAFVHINGVDYELAGTFEERHVEEIAQLLASKDGEQRIEVLIGGRRTMLRVDRGRVWASGAAFVRPPSSVYDDNDLTVV